MVTRPKLLVMDEPTEGIQPSIIKAIGRAIAFLRDQGHIAIVLVTKFFDFAVDLAKPNRGDGPWSDRAGGNAQRDRRG